MNYGLRATNYGVRILLVVLLCFLAFTTLATSVYADNDKNAVLSDTFQGRTPDEKPSLMGSLAPECVATGRCTLCDALQIFAVIAKWMLGFAGSISLLFFIYGGFLFLTSGGSESKVTAGKTALTNATIGLSLVLGSWLIVNTILVLTTGSAFSKDAASIKFMSSPVKWSEIQCGPTGGRADDEK